MPNRCIAKKKNKKTKKKQKNKKTKGMNETRSDI